MAKVEIEGPISLDSVIEQQNKKYGDGTCFLGSKLRRDPLRIPTGVFSVDFAVGGGMPVGESTCLWGPECLDGESVVVCRTSNPKTGKQHSCKHTTLKRLFERFHERSSGGKGCYVRKESKGAAFSVSSVNAEGRIFHNPILDVVSCGEKKCWQISSESGLQIVAGENHEFMLEDGSFRPLARLCVGDRVLTHRNVPYTGVEKKSSTRKTANVKYHPLWPLKIVSGYKYHRGQLSHAVYEARLNGLALKKYLSILNSLEKETIAKLKFIPKGFVVHHKDGNHGNNREENHELKWGPIHNRDHALENHNDLRFTAVSDEIVWKKFIGKRETFDICCNFPHNNYVANGFVVHNSGGKSSLGIHAMHMVDSICWRCFHLLDFCSCSTPPVRMRSLWADAEGSLDQEWAECLGARPDSYVVALADYGEQFVNIADAALRSEELGLLIVDSLASLVPEVEMEAPLEDQFYAAQARLISRTVRKLKQRLLRERKRGHLCAVLFTNQLRAKLGVTYGSNETMSGGHAMLHEFSLLLRCVRKSLDKAGVDAKYIDPKTKREMASRHAFSIKKDKVMTLAQLGEYVRLKQDVPELGLHKGQVDDFTTVLTYAKEYGVVEKNGKGWVCKVGGEVFPKLEDVKEAWVKQPSLYLETQREIIEVAKKRLRGL